MRSRVLGALLNPDLAVGDRPNSACAGLPRCVLGGNSGDALRFSSSFTECRQHAVKVVDDVWSRDPRRRAKPWPASFSGRGGRRSAKEVDADDDDDDGDVDPKDDPAGSDEPDITGETRKRLIKELSKPESISDEDTDPLGGDEMEVPDGALTDDDFSTIELDLPVGLPRGARGPYGGPLMQPVGLATAPFLGSSTTALWPVALAMPPPRPRVVTAMPLRHARSLVATAFL